MVSSAKQQELLQKGWKQEEVDHARKILDQGFTHDKFLAKVVFYSALLVIIFANVMISFLLVPFMIVLSAAVLYPLVIVLAAVIGFLYNFLINDIGHLDRRHHYVALLLVPVLSLLNMVAVVLLANRFIVDLEVGVSVHSPLLVALVFAVAFVLPSLIDEFVLKKN